MDSSIAERDTMDSKYKPTPHLWHEKTQEIIKMRLQFPAATNAELARRLNVSREWVRRVLSRANLPTRATLTQIEYCELVCDGCGIIFRRQKAEVKRLLAKGQTRFFHDRKCWNKNLRRYIKIPSKRKWDYEAVYKLHREKNWGYVRISRELGIPKPTVELILKKGNLSNKRQKWNHEAVYSLRREKGWGCMKISRELGMPKGTVSYILRKADLACKK